MKKTTLLSTTIALIGFTTTASATNAHIYANTTTAYNAAILQHTIAQVAFSSFTPTKTNSINHLNTNTNTKNPTATYGHAPMYGTAPIYGEYNDDGLAGRSGGDAINARHTLNNLWFDWQHANINTNLDSTARLGTKYNLFMAGLAGGETRFKYGHATWGIYSGFLDAQHHNHDITTKSQGGLFGVYNKYATKNFNLAATVNGGVIDNTSDTIFGTDEHTNFWISGTLNTTYDIALDSTFTLQPGIQTGYTWIKAENYTSASGDILTNDAFDMFEVTPTIRAIKHIGNGWYGTLDAKYVMFFTNGGDITANGIKYNTPSDIHFSEYGLSLEKSVGYITLRANIARRDGAHDGWIGGLNFKYLF